MAADIDGKVERIDEARRVVIPMVTTITFFHKTVRQRIEQLCLTEQVTKFIRERWIPARYIELVAERASTRRPPQRGCSKG